MCVSVHEQHSCEMSGSEIQSRFTRHALPTTVYNEKKGSGKVRHFEEYAFVTPKIGAFLGHFSYCPQKVSEGERAERCAHQRVPPPPFWRFRPSFFAKFPIFCTILEW